MLFSRMIKSGLSALMVGTALTSLTSPAIAQANTESVDPDFGNPNTESVDPNLNDYAWFLRWKDGGVQHFGKLIMNNNNHGKLIVYTDVLKRPVRQGIKLRRNANSFILQGYRPTHPNYSADRFRFQLGNRASDIVKMEHCSTGPCVPIHFQKYRRY